MTGVRDRFPAEVTLGDRSWVRARVILTDDRVTVYAVVDGEPAVVFQAEWEAALSEVHHAWSRLPWRLQTTGGVLHVHKLQVCGACTGSPLLTHPYPWSAS